MDVLLICLVVVVANGLGTLTGFGLSTVMIPVMVLFYPMPQALLFVGIIHWFGDIWKLVLFRAPFRWRLILGFAVPGVIATVLGAILVFSMPAVLMSRVLGVFLVLYAVFISVKGSFRIKENAGTTLLGGGLSGFLAGIFGMGGTVRSLFLLAFDLPKTVYVVTAGAIALAVDTARLGTYFWKGSRLEPRLLWGMVLFVPASFLGAKLARGVVDRIPQKHFRRVICGFLLVVGVKLLVWPA